MPAASSTPSAIQTLGPLPPEVGTGPRNRSNVALTFHGQGDPLLVQQLLAELERGGARVTVLAVGTWLSAQPAIARRILDGGHELGNHTQNHLAIAQMPASQAYAEIDACAQTLKRLTGSIGTWFRPSQTQHATDAIQSQAALVGYPTCLSYDVDSLDYVDPGPDAVVRTTLESVGNGSIVSLHCGHMDTVTAMPALLDGLRQRGLRPVTMTELMSP
jgi:peptidoglycan/xylan/chitin deacetylase (PgdA/CDA1 family)